MYDLKKESSPLYPCWWDTHNELRGDDPIHDGTEKRCNDSNADEYYGCQELKDRVKN